jgi:hypothetical protein
MADVISESMGGWTEGIMGQIGVIGWGLLIGAIIIVVILVLWKQGKIWNKQKTIAFNWEERGANGEMQLIDSDLSGTQKTEEGLKYKLKHRDRFVNPPPLKLINRLANGKDVVFFYWPDRDEAYAFKPRRFTADYIKGKANEAYKKAHEREPMTLEEFHEGLSLMQAQESIFFRPAIDESSANLVMTELSNINSLYSNKFMSMLKEWAPMIGLVLVVLITIVGFMWIKDGLSSMRIVCDFAGTATEQAVNNIPGMPEIPA